MYSRRSRLTARQQSELIKLFVAEATARATAEIVGVNRNTAVRFFMVLRKIVAARIPTYRFPADLAPYFEPLDSRNQGENDEKSNNPQKALFGLFKRNELVCTTVHPDLEESHAFPLNPEEVWPESIVYSDRIIGVTLNLKSLYFKRIKHPGKHSDSNYHIDRIEYFWHRSKRQMLKYNGIKYVNFYWYLKECEWRFNGGNHRQLLKQLKYWYKHSKH